MWAALFPGQGSQSVGMGKFFFDNFTVAKHLFEEASDVLSQDFRKLCFEGPESDLALTENTQPSLLLVSICALRSLQEKTSFSPKAFAGHSVGEYAAVVAAESLSFADALKAVKLRGQAMQEAVPVGEGGMLAVLGLEDQQVEDLCTWAEEKSGLSGLLQPANFNSPGQVVVSGHQSLVQWVADHQADLPLDPKPRRLKLIPLKVSAPFHCALMKPAEERMREFLGTLNMADAKIPVVQNVDAEPTVGAEKLRENLVRQVTAPVQWVRCVNQIANMGVQNCVELGSGKVLQGLVKKIDSARLNTFNVQSLDDFAALEKVVDGSTTNS